MAADSARRFEPRQAFVTNVERLIQELGGTPDPKTWDVTVNEGATFSLTVQLDLVRETKHEVVPAGRVQSRHAVYEKRRDATRARDAAKADLKQRLTQPRQALEAKQDLETGAPGRIVEELADTDLRYQAPIAFLRRCASCRGTTQKPCSQCGGKGKVEKQEARHEVEWRKRHMPEGTGLWGQSSPGGWAPIGTEPVQTRKVQTVNQKCPTCRGQKKFPCDDCGAEGRVADVVSPVVRTTSKWKARGLRELGPEARKFVKENWSNVLMLCPVAGRRITERKSGVDITFDLEIPDLHGEFALYDADGERHAFQARAMGKAQRLRRIDAIGDRLIDKEIDAVCEMAPVAAINAAQKQPVTSLAIGEGDQAKDLLEGALSPRGISRVKRFMAWQQIRLAAAPLLGGVGVLLLTWGAAASVATQGGERAFEDALGVSLLGLIVCWIASTWIAGRRLQGQLAPTIIHAMKRKMHLLWLGVGGPAFILLGVGLQGLSSVG